MLKAVALQAPFCITHPLDLTIEAGERIALIGPNGAGKSTLIRCLIGQLVPVAGAVHVLDQNIYTAPKKWVAQRLAVVHQDEPKVHGFTVLEMVNMGRFPYGHPLKHMSSEDHGFVSTALRSVGLESETERIATTLSGGEYQRMRIARAVAQDPKILVLDEPLAHLDIGHAHQLARVLRSLNQTQGLTVIAAIHDLNLAAQYFDRVLMMIDGQIVADGSPNQVMTTERLESAYGVRFSRVEHPVSDRPQFLGSPK